MSPVDTSVLAPPAALDNANKAKASSFNLLCCSLKAKVGGFGFEPGLTPPRNRRRELTGEE